MKFPIVLKGKLNLIDYNTRKSYFENYVLEIDHERELLLVCSGYQCVYILPEHIDELIRILKEWKENR